MNQPIKTQDEDKNLPLPICLAFNLFAIPAGFAIFVGHTTFEATCLTTRIGLRLARGTCRIGSEVISLSRGFFPQKFSLVG